jgi:hemerythrin
MSSPKIVWTDSLSVGAPLLDRHHQELARLINELADHLSAPADSKELLNILTALDYYAGYHFEHEERVMAEHGFPGLEAHRNQHRRFSAVIAEIRRGITRGIVRPDRLYVYLTRWWNHHVLNHDMEYKPFITARPATLSAQD